MKKLLCIILSAAMAVCMLTACGESAQKTESTVSSSVSATEIPSATKEIFAMDTYMSVTAYGENAQQAVDAAKKEINRLDKLLSVGDKDSEIYRLNHNGSVQISDDTQTLFEMSQWIYKKTNGAYDITVYPLMKLWGFTEDKQRVPKQTDIDSVLTESGFDKLTLQDDILILGQNQGIDFGGIAKGYTGAKIMEIFKQYDVVSGMVSLGGNVQCYGTKTNGSLWRCGITNPDSPEDNSSLLGVVSVSDKAVITSGSYERYFKENGKTYHHIMDLKTGYPADSGLKSVTIVSDDGTLADGLSTACFILGKEKATAFWQKHSDRFDMILVTDQNEIFVTNGIKENFQSNYKYSVIEK